MAIYKMKNTIAIIDKDLVSHYFYFDWTLIISNNRGPPVFTSPIASMNLFSDVEINF